MTLCGNKSTNYAMQKSYGMVFRVRRILQPGKTVASYSSCLDTAHCLKPFKTMGVNIEMFQDLKGRNKKKFSLRYKSIFLSEKKIFLSNQKISRPSSPAFSVILITLQRLSVPCYCRPFDLKTILLP